MPCSGLLSMVVVALLGLFPAGDAAEARPVRFKLQDFRGAWHELDEVKDRKIVVLAFLGTECPIANVYAPRLAELARIYEKKGVAFFGVDSNETDAPSKLAQFAKDCDLSFPLLKDVGNELADRLAVERTPEVFVLDSDRTVRYRGRVDDQFGLGIHRAAPTRRDLADAIENLLAGRAVATSRTEPAGCKIGRVAKASADAKVTYTKDVARILRDRCVACHRAGEIAPFSLNSYKQAAGWASMIDEVVQGGRMPPWHANPAFGKFSNNAQLKPEEKQAIADWVAAGAPEGDASDLPEPARYVEGWRIPAPDLRISLPRTVKIQAEGTMPYENFLVDPKLKDDVWVRASQVRAWQPRGSASPGCIRGPAGRAGFAKQNRLPGGLRTRDATTNLAGGGREAHFRLGRSSCSRFTTRRAEFLRPTAARSAWCLPIPRPCARK